MILSMQCAIGHLPAPWVRVEQGSSLDPGAHPSVRQTTETDCAETSIPARSDMRRSSARDVGSRPGSRMATVHANEGGLG